MLQVYFHAVTVVTISAVRNYTNHKIWDFTSSKTFNKVLQLQNRRISAESDNIERSIEPEFWQSF